MEARYLETAFAAAAAEAGFHPRGFLGIVIAALCSFIGLSISLITIYQHLLHYTTPLLQRSVVRILFITPVYSVLSLGSLLFTDAYIYLDAIRDIWEAIVVYCFLSLILDYCGGENACALVIQKSPGAIQTPWPMSQCLFPEHFKHAPILLRRTIPLDPAFVKACKRATLQFVGVKPAMAIITVVVSLCAGPAILEEPGWLWPQAVVYNTSYTIALYALALFYAATKNHAGLEGTRPIRKFAAVKIIVFATFWQSLLMFLLFHARWTSALLRAWNLFLLCVEMPFIAALQAWAFPVSEFSRLRRKTKVTATSDTSLMSIDPEKGAPNRSTVETDMTRCSTMGPPAEEDPSPVTSDTDPYGNSGAHDANAQFSNTSAASQQQSNHIRAFPKALQKQLDAIRDPERRRVALINAKDVMSVSDVMRDAYYSFGTRYANHSLLVVGDGATAPEQQSPSPPPSPTESDPRSSMTKVTLSAGAGS